MKKKGQVTLFIILAIIIVAGIILYFSLDKGILQKSSPEFNEINDIIEECIKETSQDIIYLIGQTGGYYITEDIGIYYYYKDGQTIIPEKKKIEYEISKGINDLSEYCKQNLQNLSTEIIESNIESQAIIENEKVIVTTSYYAITEKNEKRKQIENSITLEIPARIGLILDSSKEIITNFEEEICLTCITIIAQENEFRIDITKPYNTTYFTITDELSQINKNPLQWKFAYEN